MMWVMRFLRSAPVTPETQFSGEPTARIRRFSRMLRRKPGARCPFLKLLRHRRVRVLPPDDCPATRPVDETKRQLPPPCASWPPGCPGGVRGKVRAQGWIRDEHFPTFGDALRQTRTGRAMPKIPFQRSAESKIGIRCDIPTASPRCAVLRFASFI